MDVPSEDRATWLSDLFARGGRVTLRDETPIVEPEAQEAPRKIDDRDGVEDNDPADPDGPQTVANPTAIWFNRLLTGDPGFASGGVYTETNGGQ
ncbi:hypothetical protein H7J77_17190 [Mycolicibacillus parakoreensis]|uniref:Uncharacterized protein n=1 Tax=Mycolicibacillus parakoreensis TaxID=1069221 RepID=A0ABY3TYU9_9MYCO|nr:hypothetical protein [Mycolicibacillus parakoreensis]MCV7317272.1 hypothetical protein [Mycolicibacillus parakoreensis]ULN51516.1 hypothetical protein MIU77_11420 [Mycolicibacillus parakoreensis]